VTKDLREQIRGERTILGAFDEIAAEHGSRNALVFLGESLTFARLRELSQKLAGGLEQRGIRPGDRVLLYLPNSPQWLIAYLGLQYLGAAPVPISPIYTPRELRYLLQNSGAKAVVCSDTNYGHAREAAGPDVEAFIWTNIADLLPRWKRWAGHLFDRIPTGSVEQSTRSTPFAELVSAQPLSKETEKPAPDKLSHILYTGGTTGFPKGVSHSHDELLSGIIGLRSVIEPHIGSAKSGARHTLLVALPLFHMFTIDMVFALALHLGHTVILLPKPKPDAILDHIDRYRATLLIGVPSLYRILLLNDRLHHYDLGSLQYCWSAGDVLPTETATAWTQHTQLPIYQIYGSTETVAISASPLGKEPQTAGLGHVVPTRSILVVDPDTLEPVAMGSAGELLVRAESSYADSDWNGKYWNNPEETQRSYVEAAGQLWCRTGDFVRQSPEGEIEFVDRRADLIKHKGYRVSASRVESVLLDHPAVVAAAVVGTPDATTGENIKAFVILDESARGVTALELTKHCRERLLRYEIPSYIEFRDMLPKSKVGKLLRRELKEEERRRADQTSEPGP